MKKICISGATSFIAINLINRLKEENYEIYAIIRNQSKSKNKIPKDKKIHLIELNMENYKELPKYINNCDVFFHFAWNGTRGNNRENKKIQKSNYKYSKELLKNINKLQCKIFVMAGSQAEYGIMKPKTKETEHARPLSYYGKEKLHFYRYAKKFCQNHKIKLYELRFFSLYGPEDDKSTLIMNCVSKMMKNEDIDLTSGNQQWNYLYIKDTVEILIRIMSGDYPGGIYNIGSSTSRRLKDYILEIKNITNSKSKLNFGKIKSKELNLDPDISKVTSTLNWKEKYSFEEGIKEIIQSGSENNEKN